MIRIVGMTFNPETIIEEYPPRSVQRKILKILSSSDDNYIYDSVEQLKFELNLRYNIIEASKNLYKSGFAFEVFRESRCNPKYWRRTDNGGFLLKEGVKPSSAINDIYINGSKYGTECATAIVIIFYKGVLNIVPEQLFNRLFPVINLMNWNYIDDDLGIAYYRNVNDPLPGDCRYFKNPDVDPETPQWQGENAIDLGDGYYYGHGIGIKTAEDIVRILNSVRRDDATQSAYLLDSSTRPDFNHLSDVYYNYISSVQFINQSLPSV